MNCLYPMMGCETMKGVLTKIFQNPFGNKSASMFKNIDYGKYKGMELKVYESDSDDEERPTDFKAVKNFSSSNEQLSGIEFSDTSIESPNLDLVVGKIPKDLQKEKTQDEIIEVRHLLINLASMNLRRKLDHIKKNENLDDFKEISLNELLLKINEEHSNDIEKFQNIRQVTDFQFQTTFKLNLLNLMMMLGV